MNGFDAVMNEFVSDPSNYHNNNTWGILGRMLGPAYIRPPDDIPANNGNDRDPRPFYLSSPSPRGPYVDIGFETDDPYNWVRTDMTNQAAVQDAINRIQTNRDYLKSLGCTYTG